MPKKFLISTLIAGLAVGSVGLAAPVSAETVIDGTTYWEINELEPLGKSIAETKSVVCGDSGWECENYLSQAYAASLGDKYYAVEAFLRQDFMLTAVNPNNHTVKIRYIKEHQDEYSPSLTKIRIFWWPGSESHSSTYPSQLDNDTTAAIVYSEAVGSENFEELLSGQEIEIAMPEEFFTTGSRIVRFLLEYGTLYSYGGRNLSSYPGEALSEGQEYRVVYSRLGNIGYIPLEIATTATQDTPTTPSNNVTPADTEEASVATTAAPATKYIYRTITVTPETDANGEVPSSTETTIDQPSAEDLDATPLADVVTYPIAGDSVDHYNASGEYFEFPWWILALVAAGVVSIAWFFAGKRQK